MKWGTRVGLIGLMWIVAACASHPPSAAIEVTPIAAATSTRSPMPSLTATVIRRPTLLPATITQPPATSTPRSIVSTPIVLIEIPPASTLPTCPPLPTPTALDTQAAVQHFEHGLLFWLQTNNEIWALIDSPLEQQFYWRVLPNLWVEGTPEIPANGLTPLAKRYVPVRGFGQAWRSQPLRDDLGWAIDEETGFNTTLTYYPQGFYAPDCTWEPKSGLYELKDDHGQVFQFVGAGGIARRMTNNK
jgi:hypothetical protein